MVNNDIWRKNMNPIQATVNGESMTIINITIDGINLTVIGIDSNGDIKTVKMMAQDNMVIATGAVV
jgi:hypothetical protein